MSEPTENKLELLAKFVTVNTKHNFTDEERLQQSHQIARLLSEIETEEAEKKARASEYKNKIDKLKAEAKLISGHITNGYAFIDKPAELYLDYTTNERVYFDKHDQTELLRETFHASDYQKKLVFEGTQEQIDENNTLFDYAEGESGATGLKPTPKDNLGEDYGKFHEVATDNPDDNDLIYDRNGNLTDIHPAKLKDELENGPGSSELEKVIKEKIKKHREAKNKS